LQGGQSLGQQLRQPPRFLGQFLFAGSLAFRLPFRKSFVESSS